MQGTSDIPGTLLEGSDPPAHPGDGKGGPPVQRQPRRGRWLAPWLGLALCLLATLLAGLLAGWTAGSYDLARFNNAVETTRDRIAARMTTNAALLRGAESFFSTESGAISATEFADYVQGLELNQHYPGVLGLGFSVRLSPAADPAWWTSPRETGLGPRRPWPGGPRPELHTIVFLEPPGLRNPAALGFDMASEATRREAMTRAEATGELALSGRVNLKQELGDGKLPGFLLYMPVYVGDPPPTSVRDRRKRLLGFLYIPFRAENLFDGIFGSEKAPEVDFEVYDGAAPGPEHLLHRSGESEAQGRSRSPGLHHHRAPPDSSGGAGPCASPRALSWSRGR